MEERKDEGRKEDRQGRPLFVQTFQNCLREIKECDCCSSKMCIFLGKVKRHKWKYSKFNDIPSEK